MNRSVVALIVALGVSVGLTGCTIDRNEKSAGTEVHKQAEVKPAEKLPPVISVANGAKNQNPATPVTVKAMEGTLTRVTMSNENGKLVEGELSEDKKSWTTTEPLGFYRTYTVTAVGSNGLTTTSSFSTNQPSGTTNVALSPIPEAEVGVGQVISFNFGQPITDRKAAQDAIKITMEPKQEGGFYWLNDSVLRWRPAKYWQPGTKVTVNAKIYGANLGGGVFGGEDNSTSFTIKGGYHAVADDTTKIITIYDTNDNVVKTMPTSMGSSQWPTPNGIYTIGDRNPEMVMDSESYGLAHNKGGYKTKVQYATQMSYSGIYLHSAPWSIWAQGSTNTSHGCLNVSPENAKWFQNNLKRGDIIEVRNTIGGQLSGYDGLGDWQIPWSEWSKGNA